MLRWINVPEDTQHYYMNTRLSLDNILNSLSFPPRFLQRAWKGGSTLERSYANGADGWANSSRLVSTFTNPNPSNHLAGDWLDVVCHVMLFCLLKTSVWSPETRILFKFWNRQLLSWINRRCHRVETKGNCWNHGTLHLVYISVSEGFLSNLDLVTWQKLVNVLWNVSHFTYTELKDKLNKSPSASTSKWMNLYSNIHVFCI